MTPALFIAVIGAASAMATNQAAFRLSQQDATWWLESPKGERFFSVGVCTVSRGPAREDYDPENPAYAAWRFYSDKPSWADATLSRLKSWKFTTVGAWSDHRTLLQSSNMTMWLTPVLHIGSTAGAPWWDMWDKKITDRMEAVARDQIMAVRDDPRLLGYYTDNEMGWWNATLFKMTLEQAPGSGQRKRLLQLLRTTYGNDWNKLLQDFDAENANSFGDLQRHGMLYLKSGGDGIHVMRKFLALLADRYYSLAREIIRKYDPRALILGDRYQSFYYPEVAEACGRYMDAISSNLNAHWNDGTFLRSYLDVLYDLTGKPIFISEMYMSAVENGSGNRNSEGRFPLVQTQAQRAEGTRTTLETLIRVPYLVGIDWFQYADEPQHGRADGENWNFGLVDIHDHPYAEVTQLFAGLDAERLKQQPAVRRADASTGIPPAPKDPFANFTYGEALRHWDRERGYVKPMSKVPMAELYVCWNPQAIYLGLYSTDIIEDAYYRSRFVPKTDRPLWSIYTGTGDAITARLGAGREPLINDPTIRIENLSGLNINVRNVAIMELPASRFGKDQFRPGDTIDLAVKHASHCKAYQTEWGGRFNLK